jgi:hypothetical protein
MSAEDHQSAAWRPPHSAEHRPEHRAALGGHGTGPKIVMELAGEVELRVGSLHRIVGCLNDVVEGSRRTGPVFDLSQFEARARAIATMRNLHAELTRVVALVAKSGAAAENLHLTELKSATEGLARAASVQVAECGFSARTTWGRGSPDSAAPAAIPRPLELKRRAPVQVAGNIYVDAVELPPGLRSPAEVFAAITSNELYYVPGWNHFAVKVAGCVLHAGLGHIYRGAPFRGGTGDGPPRCVKECHRSKCAGEGCQYYHDPEEFPGSANVRNFMAESWCYAPAASPARYGARRIGSAGDLENDIRSISVEDARKFIHQVSHDLLCAMVLWQHVVRPARRGTAASARDRSSS